MSVPLKVLEMLLPTLLGLVTPMLRTAVLDLVKLAEKALAEHVDGGLVAALSGSAPILKEAFAPVVQSQLQKLWNMAKGTPNPWDNMLVSLVAGCLEIELQG